MPIDDLKLIQGLIGNNEALAATARDGQSQAILKSSQTILLELKRRADFAEAARYYREGLDLVVAAAAMLAGGTPRATALKAIIDALPSEMPANLNSQACSGYIDQLRQCLRMTLDQSDFPFIADEGLKSLLFRMVEWEKRGYQLPAADIPPVSEADRPVTVDGALLQRYLRAARPGHENARVVDCTPLPGGFSKQTVLFDVENDGRVDKLVYRGTTKIQVIGAVIVDIAREFHAVSYAHSQGAPVAEPLWLQSDSAATGTRFFVSRRMPGSNLGTAIAAHRDVSPAATRSLAEALAKIHGLPLDPANPLLRETGLLPPDMRMSLPAAIRRRIAHWSAYWKSLECAPHPLMDLAFQWLHDNVSPAEDELVFVHGDYGLHNILIHEDRVTAVLDWEACFIGDRALDLSHILAGTTGRMDQDLFMKAYIDAGGKPVSQFRLKYYQVLMAAQFMLSTIDAQHIYQHRAGAGTNYCTLGLGFIHHTAETVVNGILDASAAK